MSLNKTVKIVTTIMLMLTIIATITTVAFAIPNPGQVTAGSVSGTSDILDFGGKIMSIIQTVGVVLSVVILVVLGVKYMMGSAEEKAEYKKSMIPYLVGAVLIFGASTIANIVFQFANSAGNGRNT